MGNAGGERTRVLVEAQSQASSRARRRNYRTRIDDRVGEHQVTVQTKVARNFPRSFFETARKRCNSNVLNSMFEILARELRATLLGNHADISTEEAADAQNTSGATGKAKHQTEDTTGKAEHQAAPA